MRPGRSEHPAGEGLLEAAREMLDSVFGYPSFRGQQESVIRHVLSGKHGLALMPTGAGKSLCYQIPALVSRGVGVVISPLVALMHDQVDSLRQLGVNAAYLDSTLAPQAVHEVERALQENALDLLYISPERLGTGRMLALLQQLEIALFAIDEAHCLSQWGHDFRSDYLRLTRLAEQFPQVPRLALTATADVRTREEIIRRLEIPEENVFVSSFDRPNIRYRITEKHNPRDQLLRFIRWEHESDAGIVYCMSRKKVDDLAAWLGEKGLTALPYHAGLTPEVRQENQRRFLLEEGIVMVATIAFGMGIDKPNVRFVAHLDLPRSPEAYYQETGRAGRDGLPADAWMSYGLQDVINLRRLIEATDADEQHKQSERRKLEAMLGLCEMVGCRRQALLKYFGDEGDAHCGNCDNCLEPVDSWDASLPARQALSCVYRSGQRYGVKYLTEVLQGKLSVDVLRRGHENLSTFGLGKTLDARQWQSVFRQLLAQGYLAVDSEGYGALKLDASCRPLLRGETMLQLRQLDTARQRPAPSGQELPLTAGQELLWQRLKDERRLIAQEQKIPPYMIFHDSTLKAMLTEKPLSLHQLRGLPGVGERKLKAYGERFLAVIADDDEQLSATDTAGS